MKRRIIILFQLIATVAMLFTTNSCSNLTNNPLQDKETGDDITLLLLDPNFFDTKLVLKFEDFDTGELLIGKDITAALKGDMAGSFVNLFGEKNETYTTSSGIIELYLDPAITIGENAMELEAVAVAEPLWLSTPTNFEINNSGERTIIVRMINWDNSKSTALKSASSINNVTIDVTASTSFYDNTLNYPDGGYFLLKQYLTEYDAPVNVNLMCVFYGIGCDNTPPSPPTVSFEANSISGIDETLLSFWGFKENNSKTISVSAGKLVTTAYKRNNTEKCSNGITIKVNAPELTEDELKTASSSFNYKITFSDGSTKTGAISGLYKNLKEIGNNISPIYYPNDDSQVTVTLQDNSQFTFEQATKTLSSPCGEVTFVAKKKSNLVNYNFTVTYTCSVAGLTYTGTGLFKNLTKDTQPETFNLSVGGFSLNLIKGDKYQLTVIIDNDAYSLNIDTKDISGSLSGQSIDGNTVTNVTVSGNDSNGYNVGITISLTDKICGKISG